MIDSREINLPDVMKEVHSVFERYERALVDNDLAVLDELFWDSDWVIRYGGAGENLHGIAAIRNFRAARLPAGLARTLFNTVITTIGWDLATANTEFRRTHDGAHGRQSQTWARLAEGWRIVSAHVSLIPVKPAAT